MVKINIISGFLGAGKTTLIKKLLTGSLKNEKVVLVENEYGEVGVDGSFMKDSGIVINEMNSGCICCTLAGDFQKSIDELISTYHPDRILVEPTGVGKLSEIIAAIEKCRARHDDIEISGSATVVDAGKCRMYMKNFGEFFIDQVKHASTIILSRTQLLSVDRVEKSRALVAEQNPEGRIITTPWDELDPDMILRVIENGKPIEVALLDEDDDDDDDEDEHEHHHHHDHDEHEEHEYHHPHYDEENEEMGDDDEDEHEHHHHDDDDDHDHDHDEHEHHHHHDHEDGECDDPNCSCHHHHHHHHHDGEHDADEVFQNVGLETARRYEQDEIRELTAKLADEEEYGTVLRAKGILQTAAGDWFQFDYVPGELQIRPGTADYTGRLCVIGANLNEKSLKELLKA